MCRNIGSHTEYPVGVLQLAGLVIEGWQKSSR
jgi:hypothetical protein